MRGEGPMKIVCPNGDTAYQVQPSAVGPSGRSVRCARCQTVWFAANTAALSEIAASHRAEMAQFATTASERDAVAGWPDLDEGAPADGLKDKSDAPAPDPADIGHVHDAPPIA